MYEPIRNGVSTSSRGSPKIYQKLIFLSTGSFCLSVDVEMLHRHHEKTQIDLVKISPINAIYRVFVQMI